MTIHSDQQVFPGGTARFSPHKRLGALVVNANGGSVAVEVSMTDGTWIAISDSPIGAADPVVDLELSNRQYRFTPSGGATYEFFT